MTLRRFTGALASFFLLHLVAVGADLACATHSHDAATTPVERAHASHDAQPEDDGQPSAPNCDVPVRPQCCEAFTSCTVTFGVAPALRRAEVPLATLGVAGFSVRTPSFGLPAPEPPPPKA